MLVGIISSEKRTLHVSLSLVCAPLLMPKNKQQQKYNATQIHLVLTKKPLQEIE